MKILLDTCVISELQKPNGNASVKKVVSEVANHDVFLSVITLGELSKGIALLDDGARKTGLRSWLNGLEESYASNIIKTDKETAHIWGELTARAQKQGKQIPASDGLIAATALQYGLYVITRNISDFEYTGALLINPWNN
ncbi:MAG: type II toxin-antitoxin system VapC family toxin [Thiotrichaceae bacterium]|nr:type II toxin-antitoxin system VapC family toxin [Thiotrichaceae bacterium]